ncbi:pfkB family carbohydrate kinase [Trifolium medium]|uniref:PfkB family carbohydrate kinase n=1 Tax=Trifolium medium TaxID=97028 RepID=A0A392MNZ2_9FABA|nr:pfkB family carbohydrate kinase [Trifolium medium]
MTTVDFLAKPDDNIRTTSSLISKVADDAQGMSILEELEADGV